MKSNSTITLFQKVMISLLTGMVAGACFNRMASKWLGFILPGFLIAPLTAAILVGPVVLAFVWHFKKMGDERSNSILAFWRDTIRFAFAFDLAMFGWLKIFHLQFWFPIEMLDVPFGEISSEWLTWMYFGRSYPMDFTVGVFQVAGALLLLFRRTKLIGIFVVIPMLLFVFMIDVFYDMGLVTIHAGIMLAAITYLLLTEYDHLKLFFLDRVSDLTSFKLPAVWKVLLRSSLVVVPVLFILTREASDKHPALKGKYRVEKLMINEKDMTSVISCDSVLSVVYFEVGNTAIFQFKNYQQRSIGIYDYREGSDRFSIDWVDGSISSKLEGKLLMSGTNKVQLSGKIGNEVLSAELFKVR